MEGRRWELQIRNIYDDDSGNNDDVDVMIHSLTVSLTYLVIHSLNQSVSVTCWCVCSVNRLISNITYSFSHSSSLWVNLSLNKSLNHSANQFELIIQSISQSIDQSISELDNQPATSQLANQPTSQPTNQAASQSASQPTGRPVHQSISQSASQSICQSINLSITINPSVSQLINQSINQYLLPCRQRVLSLHSLARSWFDVPADTGCVARCSAAGRCRFPMDQRTNLLLQRHRILSLRRHPVLRMLLSYVNVIKYNYSLIFTQFRSAHWNQANIRSYE